MDIWYLEELVIFSKHLNYSAASRELCVSQSSLSQRIAKMEEELGFELVSRDGKPTMTEAGDLFCSNAHLLVNGYKELVRECKEVAEKSKGRVRVADLRQAISISDDLARLARIEAGESRNPYACSFVALDLIAYKNELTALDEGFVDVSFVFSPHNSPERISHIDQSKYKLVRLRPERCVVQVDFSSPFASGNCMHVDNLVPFTIVEVNTPYFETCDASIRLLLEGSGHDFSFVVGSAKSKENLSGLGKPYAAIKTKTAANVEKLVMGEQFAFLDLEGVNLEIQPYAVYRKDNPNPYLQDFMKCWGTLLDEE